MIKKREKLKLTQYIQIYKNNDPLLLNLVNKYVFVTRFPEFATCWFISALVKHGILSSDFPHPSLRYFTLEVTGET